MPYPGQSRPATPICRRCDRPAKFFLHFQDGSAESRCIEHLPAKADPDVYVTYNVSTIDPWEEV